MCTLALYNAKLFNCIKKCACKYSLQVQAHPLFAAHGTGYILVLCLLLQFANYRGSEKFGFMSPSANFIILFEQDEREKIYREEDYFITYRPKRDMTDYRLEGVQE